ncbi:MAG TPA: DUF4124 domain-containing protein [Usitatibacter sp.]|nr:DUF4124 domain-containing protein [Usitatibacter sp.]
MERKRGPVLAASLAALVLLASATAAAQTVYKLIDRNGKVTYSETAPKDFDGQVIRIDLDPNANKASLGGGTVGGDRGPPGQREQNAQREAEVRKGHEQQIEAARAKVEDARKALDEARNNPGPDDIRWVGNKGGGTRQVPTEAYQQRLATLEKALQEAKDELKKLEGGD